MPKMENLHATVAARATIALLAGGFLAVAASAAQAQYPNPMQRAAADYAGCVNDRARAAEQKGRSIEDAIAAGFAACKGQRSRTVAETRARIVSAGLPASTAKQSAEAMVASVDSSLAGTLRQEFSTKRGGAETAPHAPN